MAGENPTRGLVTVCRDAVAHLGADDPVRVIVENRARELAAAETNLDEVLDAAERLVTQLGQQRLLIRSRRNILLLTRVVRVQFQNLRLFDQLGMPEICRSEAKMQQHYLELAAEFELQFSQDRLIEKAKLLDTIMRKTIVSRSRLTENWLLRLEILLLMLFPLFQWLFE
jgi:hypothetical protein